ncbi:MAG: hypothetical protein L6R37_007536 [Teloschistes peruensis]|nr:MAG: hypothetical protein L6R37_007536 [Teloschistes peruensis]
MQAANRVQKALSTGSGLSFGAWQMLAGSNVSRMIARSGFDWVVVDTEHGNIDAHGIIVPLLNTVEDAKALVKSAKFPPTGQRGFGSPFAMERFGNITQTEYLQQANDSLLTIVQIETRDALHNVDAIAKVPGIDVLFCGPFDLGNNIGHPILDGTMHDELKEAVAKIQRVAKDNKKASGIYATSGDQARQYADQGFNMVSVATDAALLPASMESALTAARGSYVHSALNIAKGAFRSQ